ncbi:ATP-binding protein [Streptomyces sp. ODS28]|uniref:ATP-binding protein n=1 Tax=Streptomyces sp. ODS28 TaxID=3136688 RepID=UPI0031E9A5F6
MECILPPTLVSAHWARRLTTGFLTGARAPEAAARQADEAALIVSELVTNAVRHGRGRCRLRITAQAGDLTVEVHDHGEGTPRRQRADAEREGGRGMALVHHLARRLQTTPHPRGGKTVRAVLALG